MDIKPLKDELEPQASSHIVKLQYGRDEMVSVFNEYWTQVKDKLSPELIEKSKHGGYRDVSMNRVVRAAGGIGAFFRPVLVELLRQYFTEQPLQPLLVSDVDIADAKTHYVVNALVMLEPTVEWVGPVPGIDNPLSIDIPKYTQEIFDRTFEAELNTVRDNSPVLVPATDNELVKPDQIAVVDCESVVDGEKWHEGSFIAKKFVARREFFRNVELFDLLMTMKAGESKSTTFKTTLLSDDLAERDVTVNLRVIQLYDAVQANLDDSLAKSNGFESLDALKAEITKKVNNMITQDRDMRVNSSIMNQIINPKVVTVTAVPFNWMAQKAREVFKEGRGMVKSDEEMLAQFNGAKLIDNTPVTTMDTVLMFLAQQSARQLVVDLVVRAWGKKAGVEGDMTLDNIREYGKTVKEKIASVMVLNEVEAQPAAAPQTDAPVTVKDAAFDDISVVQDAAFTEVPA